MRSPLRLALVPTLAAIVLLLGAVSTAAFTSGSTGYDIGCLQCGTAYPSRAFGIVGVDSGWPFISSLPSRKPQPCQRVCARAVVRLVREHGF